MRVVAVPVKSLSRAKTRLSPALTGLERGALTLAMLEDVLDAALSVPARETWVAPPDEGAPQVPAASTKKNEPTAAATRAAPQAPATASAVVPSDQLNDVDRSLTETRSPPATTIALASLSTPLPTATASKDDSTWANTSLIGKIFIAFGGLLTLASAARMMIA